MRQPSAMARGLQKQRTDTVMLLVPDVADMYYPQLIRYMGMLCWQQGKRMLLGGTEWNPVQEAGYLRQAMTGPITPSVPASIIQLHPDVTVVADEAALGRIRMA